MTYKEPRFKVGDRVMLTNLLKEDPPEPADAETVAQKHVWRNGRLGTVVNVPEGPGQWNGHRPELKDSRKHEEYSYSVRFDGYDYRGNDDNGGHSPNGALLAFASPTDEEVAALFGFAPPPPEPHCQTCTCHEETS